MYLKKDGRVMEEDIPSLMNAYENYLELLFKSTIMLSSIAQLNEAQSREH